MFYVKYFVGVNFVDVKQFIHVKNNVDVKIVFLSSIFLFVVTCFRAQARHDQKLKKLKNQVSSSKEVDFLIKN